MQIQTQTEWVLNIQPNNPTENRESIFVSLRIPQFRALLFSLCWPLYQQFSDRISHQKITENRHKMKQLKLIQQNTSCFLRIGWWCHKYRWKYGVWWGFLTYSNQQLVSKLQFWLCQIRHCAMETGLLWYFLLLLFTTLYMGTSCAGTVELVFIKHRTVSNMGIEEACAWPIC